MLFHLFHDIRWDETKFVQLTIGTRKTLCSLVIYLTKLFLEKRYQSVKNRRELFDSFAKFYAFDPLVAKNWYNISAAKLGNLRVCSLYVKLTEFQLMYSQGILQFYSNSVARAIQHLYPEIGINQSNYPSTHQN